MRIAEAARKHGIPDEDIQHAAQYAIRRIEQDDVTMLIGPARSGNLLEVGVLAVDTDDPVAIHAMTARPSLL